ncbi:glutamyl-tRNA reductase [Maribacter cobaltidurans]|uniref:Glutamyl-tRNA reductase n=1 Tax=Maribacter cobaltidurans TaxID=1178778 RepID=A0A223V4K7_9FLAO|nr:glutamyl-tRNA reductase [Maribacter cobaltidurans]ASV30070.1 glutamyl-tRNA reductase [Maribacter cobaltidurans]GGD87428.1 glutamyl-tRNA reductase [Maribacter cobaltidurans]
MKDYHISKHNSFYTIGLNYKKADAEVRGKFSLDEASMIALLEKAKEQGIDGLLATSTCNRTELHGFAQHPFQLIKLLCDFSHGSVEEFQEVAYVYKNKEAIAHLFRVGTGLDSQILGDFEIISQLKQSFFRSKKQDIANPFIERLVNAVIQASKRIKNETEISSGATSVAFASVQYILNNVENISGKNILLFGTGKIGRNTCENLIKHTKNPHITLINRTKEKADKVGGKFNLTVKDYGDLQAEIRKTDVLVVATGAQKPTVCKELIYTKNPLLILDLSIPKNVDDNVLELDNVSLLHLDHLSQMTDETLEKRKLFIPKAEEIIEEVKSDFIQWLETRKFAPVIKALKMKLKTMKDEELDYQSKKTSNFDAEQADLISNRIIQKITKQFANHLKDDTIDSDSSLELIQKVFQLELETK